MSDECKRLSSWMHLWRCIYNGASTTVHLQRCTLNDAPSTTHHLRNWLISVIRSCIRSSFHLFWWLKNANSETSDQRTCQSSIPNFITFFERHHIRAHTNLSFYISSFLRHQTSTQIDLLYKISSSFLGPGQASDLKSRIDAMRARARSSRTCSCVCAQNPPFMALVSACVIEACAQTFSDQCTTVHNQMHLHLECGIGESVMKFLGQYIFGFIFDM